MASWSAMDALLDARAAWERSQPQLFLDFTSLPGGETDGAASHRPPRMLTASLPAVTSHTTAIGGASPDETRATDGR